MSKMLRYNFLRNTLTSTLESQHKRCFSVSKQYFNKDGSDLRPLHSVQDVVAEFEKPLIDSSNDSDPHLFLIQSVEKFRPRKDVVSVSAMDKLQSQLSNAYNVSQLRSILVAQKLSHKGLKKQQLIDKIIDKHWGVKTTEQVKEEAIKRQMDTVKETFPASRHELFFIIGDNGNTVRNIEEKNQVKVNIDVINNQYIVEGLSASVAKAKKEILSHMNILQDIVKVPDFVKENQDLQFEVSDALSDISKVAGTFIALENNEVIRLYYKKWELVN